MNQNPNNPQPTRAWKWLLRKDGTIDADKYKLITSEKDFQGTVIELAEWHGWRVWHDNDSRRNNPGFPDLICVHPEHGVRWLELKTETGKIRKEQTEWHDALRAAGEEAYIVRPSDMEWIDGILKGER